MGNAWSNPGPPDKVIIVGNGGELLIYDPAIALNDLILAISGVAGVDTVGNPFVKGIEIVGGQSLFYNPSIALNNLLLAVSGVAGSDSVGNHWNPGVTVAGSQGGLFVYNPSVALNDLLLAIAGSAGSDAVGNTWEPGVNIASTAGGLLVYNPTVSKDKLLAVVSGVAGSDQVGNSWEPGLNVVAPAGTTGGVLIYSPTSAVSNLIASVAAADGADQYGNHFLAGLNVNKNASLSFREHSTDTNVAIINLNTKQWVFANSSADGTLNFSIINFQCQDNTGAVTNGAEITLDSRNGMQFGLADMGGTYQRYMSYSKAGVPSQLNPRTFITAFTTIDLNSIYGAAFASGVFTAPVNGYYAFDINAGGVSAAMDVDIEYSNNGGVSWTVMAQNSPPTGRATCNTSWQQFMTAGDQMRFGVSQTSGAAITIAGNLNVRRVMG